MVIMKVVVMGRVDVFRASIEQEHAHLAGLEHQSSEIEH